MLTVHHLNNSRSQRILWLLEELGLNYEVIRYERDKKTMLAPPELKKIHPLGKSPVLTDNDHILAESGAIIEYLIDEYGNGRLRPGSKEEKIKYNYWLHFAEGTAMSPLLLTLIFNRVESAPMPFFAKPIAKEISKNVKEGFINPNLKTQFDYMENELGKSAWFAGSEFSAADIQMSFPIEAAKGRGVLQGRPNLEAFLKRIHDRPAYKRALERGGEYTIL